MEQNCLLTTNGHDLCYFLHSKCHRRKSSIRHDVKTKWEIHVYNSSVQTNTFLNLHHYFLGTMIKICLFNIARKILQIFAFCCITTTLNAPHENWPSFGFHDFFMPGGHKRENTQLLTLQSFIVAIYTWLEKCILKSNINIIKLSVHSFDYICKSSSQNIQGQYPLRLDLTVLWWQQYKNTTQSNSSNWNNLWFTLPNQYKNRVAGLGK